MCSKKFWPTKFGSKKSSGPTNIWSNNFESKENLGFTKVLPSKTFGSKKKNGLKIFLSKKYKFQRTFLFDQFWFHMNFGWKEKSQFYQNFVELKLCPKLFLTQRNWVKKIQSSWVSNSFDIAAMEKCDQDKCWLDLFCPDITYLLRMASEIVI